MVHLSDMERMVEKPCSNNKAGTHDEFIIARVRQSEKAQKLAEEE